jgi:LuxR family maltose regulon positive regulatory protein
MLFRFEHATLLRWLERFPQEVLFAHTVLCRFYAWGLFFSGAVAAYEAPLQQAERLARAQEDARSLGYVYALRTYAARFKTADANAVIAWGQAALQLLPQQDREMRSVMAVMVASSYRFTGDATAAWQMATEARASSEGVGYAAAIQAATLELAEVLVLQGKLPQAAQTYQAVIDAADPWPPLTVEALLGLGSIRLQWNELDAAEVQLELASRGARDLHDDTLLAHASLLRARVIQAHGDAERARQAWAWALRLAQACSSTGLLEQAQAYQVRGWLRQGRMEEVIQWQQVASLSHDAPANYQQEVRALTLARALIAQGEADEALRLVDLSGTAWPGAVTPGGKRDGCGRRWPRAWHPGRYPLSPLVSGVDGYRLEHPGMSPPG